MSKHHADEDEPQSSDMSWIRGLSQPEDSARPETNTAYYSALVARPPRHAAPTDDGREVVPDVAQTAPIRRISAEQVDTLIGHLDAVGPVPPVDIAPVDIAPVDIAPVDIAPVDVAPLEPASVDTESDHDRRDLVQDLLGPVESPLARVESPLARVESALVRDEAPKVRSTPRRSRLRKPVLVGAAAALCVLTIGGGTATAMRKTVSIVIDGKVQTVNTESTSVAGALAAAGITPTSHDSLAPAGDTAIADGSTIVLQRGRLLTLTIDGTSKQVWTTATTVDAALAELGTHTANLALSANRSRAIPLTGLVVTGSTLHTVDVSVAGATAAPRTTTVKTVGELLAANKIVLGQLDTVTPALGTALSDGLVIKVNRVAVSTTTKTVVLAEPAAKTVKDATIVKGTSTVVQAGKAGSQQITYTVTSVNGKQTAKSETSRHTVVAPVGKITHIGTKTTFTYVGSEVFTNDTSFGVNWDGLAMCESTHNPKAINANPSAGLPTYGMFQFDLPTWASVGGSGNPIDATAEEQLMRAKLLYQSRGLEPWACAYAAH